MLGWIRGGILGAIVCLFFAACGGDDFSAEDPGNGDASLGGSSATGGSGGASSGGTAGTVSTGGAPADSGPDATSCDVPLEGTECSDLSTGDAACDQCGQDSCCPQIEACLGNETCARAMNCYLDRCFDQPAFECMPAQCPCVLGVTQLFLIMSTCLRNGCGIGHDGAPPVCPQFKE